MIKNRKAVLLLGLIFHLACAQTSPLKIKVEIPGYTPFKLDGYLEVVIASFIPLKKVDAFDLNQELTDYFREEFERRFKGKTSVRGPLLEKEEDLKNQEFWQGLPHESRPTLYLAGTAAFTQETRKALLEKAGRADTDPFSSRKSLEERRVFTLELKLFFINGETGAAVFEKNFKETLTSKNVGHLPSYAFFELAQRIKIKLFHTLMEEARPQERYLLLRS